MEVYKFDKSFLERMDELESVSVVPMNHQQLQEEWVNFIEVGIEPSGWHAIWKIPRATCEIHNIKFPTEVFGIVDQVIFSDLQAVFTVLAVQDETVHLPESNVVCLDELFVTKNQENPSLNVDITADILDRLRFFNSYCKMPWDDTESDELNWNKHLVSRLQLFYDLKNKTIKKNVASYIRTLIAEAKYIQKKREILEIAVDDQEEKMAEEGMDNSVMEGTLAEELFKLHLRLSKIKAEMDLFINPEMRKMYESIKFPKQVEPVSADGKIIVVSTGRTLHGQMELLDLLKSLVPPEAILNVAATLQDAMANGGRKIYLPSGIHNMNYMEYLNDNIHLCGVKNVKTGSDQDWPIISSANNDSLLVAIDGPCNIENVQIDCKNVKTGFLIKNGSNIVLKNCTIFGGIEAIRMSGTSNVLVENCIIYDFSGTAICCNDESQLHMKNTIIRNCGTGIEISHGSKLKMEGCIVQNSIGVGLSKMVTQLAENVKSQVVTEMKGLESLQILIDDCKFHGNKQDIVLYNRRNFACNSTFFEDED